MKDRPYLSSPPPSWSLGCPGNCWLLVKQQTGDFLLTFDNKIGTGLVCLLWLIQKEVSFEKRVSLRMRFPFAKPVSQTSTCNICCCSVTGSCPNLRDPMDCSTTGFPVPHHLLEFAQAHIHWIDDAIQPSHPLSPSFPSVFNLSQWVSCSHQVVKVLELQLQHQSFQWVFKVDFLWDWLVWSPCFPRDSQEQQLYCC